MKKERHDLRLRAGIDWAQIRCLLDKLAPGDDVVMVMRLDRPVRSTRDPLNALAVITGTKPGFRPSADTWDDTTPPHGHFTVTVLGGPADFEKELIRARTPEGRKRAKARGVRFGRKPKLTDYQKREAIRRRDREPVCEIAYTYNVSHSTISRLARVDATQ